MHKILVTGAAGFIGSEFVRQAVAQGKKIVVVDKLTYAGDLKRLKEVKGKIKFYKTDICNSKKIDAIFKKEKFESVVHFAAESHVDRSITNPTVFLDTNIKGTQSVLDAAVKYKIKKFVHISTDEVYGEIEHGKFTEESIISPNSPYSVSKAAADMLARAYMRTYGLPVVVLRPSNNYGPWQFPEKLIPVVIGKALKNQNIPVYGKGLNVREWLFVGDCAQAVLTVLDKAAVGEIYNLGSGQEQANIDTVKTILKIMCKSNNLIEFVKDRLGHDLRYSLDTSKIEKDLGWKAKTDFSEGIKITVEWYLKNYFKK